MAGGMPVNSRRHLDKDTTMTNQPRNELAALLARVAYRLVTRQNLPHSGNDGLDVPQKTLLSVTNAVNNDRDHGDA